MTSSQKPEDLAARQTANDQGSVAEERVEPCSCCGGDGGFEVVDGPDHERCGAITHWSTCHACDGTGEEIVTVEPVTLDDLTMDEALRLDEEKLEALGAYDEQEAA